MCKKVLQNTVSKEGFYIFLLYLGKLSLLARSILAQTFRDILPCVNLKVVFRIKNKSTSKFNLISTLIFRCYSICCSMELFHIENVQLKEIF